MPAENTAVYLKGIKVRPLEVKSAPYTSPGAGEIVVKNAAVAINPVDWMTQDSGNLFYPWLKYPFVLGTDVAGEVVDVERGVTRFHVGDRVLGHAVGQAKERNRSSERGFQHYTVLLEKMSAPVPASMTFEQACVIPLGLSTAAYALYEKDQLALPYPSNKSSRNGEILLVLGGSTSVGCNAIQLGVASGYEVITTASPRNFDLVKSLGATAAFDYNSQTAVADITKAIGNRRVAGALSMGAGGAEACVDILGKCKGAKKLSMATYPMLPPDVTTFVLPRTILNFMKWNASMQLRCARNGVKSKFIFATSLIESGVGKAMYEDYLPTALEQGVFQSAPKAEVVGHGLQNIQTAFDQRKRGVNAKKLVVTL